MSLQAQLAVGTLLLMAGGALMGYTYTTLYGMPYVCAMVMLWLVMLEYAVGRAWWEDAQDLAHARRSRREL